MKKKRMLTIFKIGNEDRPAAKADIKAFRKCLKKAMKSKGSLSLVTHHAIQVEQIELGTVRVR